VCLGNICRSPMAEAAFRDLVKKEGLADRFEIAQPAPATGTWVSRPIAGRVKRSNARHRTQRTGGQACLASYARCADYVVAMDVENVADLRSWRVERQKVSRILDYVPDSDMRDVPIPTTMAASSWCITGEHRLRRLAATDPRTAQLLTRDDDHTRFTSGA